MANMYMGDQVLGTVAVVLNTADATATALDILKDKTAYVGDKKIVGTHTCETLADMTSDATAVASDILSGEIAYVNGDKVTGTMPNNGAVSQELNAGGSYTIPAGYHNGSGKVTGNSLASQTSANAGAGDIRNGKTAWVNGSQVTGTLNPGATITKQTITNTNGSSYYYDFTGTLNKSGRVLGENCFITYDIVLCTCTDCNDSRVDVTNRQATWSPTISGTTLSIPRYSVYVGGGAYFYAAVDTVTVYYVD